MTLSLDLYLVLVGALMLAWLLRRRRPPRSRTARRRTRREEMDQKIRRMLRRRAEVSNLIPSRGPTG